MICRLRIPKIPAQALVLADQAVFSGGSFALSLALVRLLSPTDFGVFSMLMLGAYLLMSITNALIIQPFQVSLAKFQGKPGYPLFTLVSQLALVGLFCIPGIWVLKTAWVINILPISISPHFMIWMAGFLMQDYFRKFFLAQAKPGITLGLDCLVVGAQLCVLGYQLVNPCNFQMLIFLLGLAYLPSLLLGFLAFPRVEFSSRNWKAFLQNHLTQGGWMLLTAMLQWWSNNLFTVASGIYIGVEALGAFRLVQSLFGILNMVFQTFENHLLPEASRLFETSVAGSKAFLRTSFLQNGLPLLGVLIVLFLFSEEVMMLAGGQKFASYHFIIKGMTVLYACILVGYPVRLAVRMMVLNQTFFIGYALAFAFSLLSFRLLLGSFQLWGAIAGLLINQLIMLIYWNKTLVSKQFILWK